MKKLILILATLGIALALPADEPRRYFELGLDEDVGLSNNIFSVTDIFKEKIVVDLDQIATTLDGSDFIVSLNENYKQHLGLKLGKNATFNLYWGVDASGYLGIPNSLFTLLADGNASDTTYTGNLTLRGDIYASAGAKTHLRFGKLGISVEPAFYIPLAHIANPSGSYSLTTASDGSIDFSGSAHIPVYSAVSFNSLSSGVNVQELATLMLQQGGVDLSVGADYQVFPEWLVAVSLQSIPLIPAEVHYQNVVDATFSYETDSLIDAYTSSSSIDPEYDYTITDSEGTFEVYRPFKFGLSAAYHPIGFKPVTLTPHIALVVYDTAYMDVGLNAQLNLANILILNSDTIYEDQIWKEKIGLILNLRILEVELRVATQSASIVGMATGKGFAAGVGVRIGF